MYKTVTNHLRKRNKNNSNFLSERLLGEDDKNRELFNHFLTQKITTPE